MERLLKRLRKAAGELYIHRRTRGAIGDAVGRLEGIQAAWLDEGPVPAYHEHMQFKLRRDWPSLANALDEACK